MSSHLLQELETDLVFICVPHSKLHRVCAHNVLVDFFAIIWKLLSVVAMFPPDFSALYSMWPVKLRKGCHLEARGEHGSMVFSTN